VKLCMVSPYSWSFPGGVIEHIDSLAGHLDHRGHEVRVVAPNDPLDLRTRMLHPKLGRHGPLPDRVTPVGRSVPLPSNGSLGNVAFSPRAFRTVRRAIRRQRPDVVHVHEPLVPLVSWAAVDAARAMKIPIVGTFHANYPTGCMHYRAFRSVLRPLSHALDVRIAVSPTAAETVAELFPGDYRIIPNGVDVSRFKPLGIPRHPGQVLFVGRPVARKGLPVLLKSFSVVLERAPSARLVIVGSAPENVKLPKKLLSSVEVRGMVDEEELVAYMRSSSLLCAPSTGGESFGMVLIEAMAAGLPVVASDIPGYEAVVSSGKNGVLVPPGDPGALADALVALLTDPARRTKLSLAGQASASRYDWSRIAAALEDVYLRLTR
jgi:phosphatidyl-myo-inositol alpha-mannosyltransferase